MQSRIVGIALIVGMLIAGGLFIANLRPFGSADEAGMPGSTGDGPNARGFSETAFKFAPAAGEPSGANGPNGTNWQTASASLSFSDTDDSARGTWSCDVVVGMPLQAEKWGKITPEYAAYASAKTASDAARAVMTKKPPVLPAEFCGRWRSEMQSAFDGIKGLDAKVSDPAPTPR